MQIELFKVFMFNDLCNKMVLLGDFSALLYVFSKSFLFLPQKGYVANGKSVPVFDTLAHCKGDELNL